MKKSKMDTAGTRQRILAAASALSLENGIANTSVNQVMDAVGMTPGGFYRHFDSKDQLVAEANRAATEKLFQYYEAAVAGMGPQDAIETIVRLYLRQSTNRDQIKCPLANLGSELRHANRHIRAAAMEGYARLSSAIGDMTRQLDIPDYAKLAETIVATIVGAVTLSRLTPDHAVSQQILENTRNTISMHIQASSRRAYPIS